MKHCLPCNLDFPDDRRFCGSCGGSLSDSTTCEFCGDVLESKWKFCTGCGNTLRRANAFNDAAPSIASASDATRGGQVANSSRPEWYGAPELLGEPDETTVSSRPRVNFVINPTQRRTFSPPMAAAENGKAVRNGKDVPTLSMLSAYGDSEPAPPGRSSRGYVVALSLAVVIFFTMFSFGGWYVWAHRASGASRQAEAAPSEESATGNQFAPAVRAEETASERRTTNADDEWKRLKRERIAASDGDKAAAVIAALEQAERKYPNDYRFSYERAKLSIKGITSHHEAFAALALAAAKAIDSGQAQEMLDNLKADADGDFWKPAHGHHEWHELLEALAAKDKNHLAELHHH
jgi:Double zinc ribbon